ncbi:hypothetical protein NITHO_2150006 [Nitrolancea hollandica Lb]|uniref:Uncharacterized protein n=1 Tax=Nitrolancea hollandica Lb TaxID=1129897 RepID=I4EF08_9BACT|nr:hypothetical protein NITHO_2150006 [Nitrolancea hollandica Lb]
MAERHLGIVGNLSRREDLRAIIVDFGEIAGDPTVRLLDPLVGPALDRHAERVTDPETEEASKESVLRRDCWGCLFLDHLVAFVEILVINHYAIKAYGMGRRPENGNEWRKPR